MTQMQQMKFEVGFLTPAFLGNTEQAGQWRTPPFKALLRQWWRVVYAANAAFDVDIAKMRRCEGFLFGNAWLSHQEGSKEVHDHSKSLVRLRLSQWNAGTLRNWNSLEQKVQIGKNRVGSHAYLGYGPLDARSGTQLTRAPAIKPEDRADLRLAAPEIHASDIRKALSLIHAYGTVGGRSRNGWGSVALGTTNEATDVSGFVRPWQAALRLEWPHAIGSDERGPLVWATNSRDDWKLVMRDLASVKMGLRKKFPFQRGNNVQDRHWLSYPVTKHQVRDWDKKHLRLPNSLRFKVRKDADGKLRGLIFHMPCLPPKDFNPDRDAIEWVWKCVHDFLDSNSNVERIKW